MTKADGIVPEIQANKIFIKKHFSRIGLSFFGAFIISSFVIAIIMLIFTRLTETNFVLITITQIILTLICFLFLRKLDRINIEKHSIGIICFLKYFSIGITMALLGNGIGIGLTSIISYITGIKYDNVVNEVLSGNNIWVVILTTIVIAPLTEEFLFRKLLIDRLIRYGKGLAILVSALMFGFFHANLYQLFYAFGFGLVLGHLYVKTGKIWCTIVMHMVFNFVSGILPTVMDKSNFGIIVEDIYTVIYGAIGIIGSVIFVLHRNQIKFDSGEVQVEKGKRISTIFLNPGMILFFCLCILSMI